MDDQFALFTEEEIPVIEVPHEVPREVIAHHIKPWSERSVVTKKAANEVVDAAYAYVHKNNLDAAVLDAPFGVNGYMLHLKKMTTDEVEHALKIAPFYHQAEKILAQWASRRTLAAKSIRSSTLTVAQMLEAEVDVEDLKYALHHRSLLASARILTEENINAAISGVEQDRKAGKMCNEIFHRWYGKYYENRYTQPIGQILQVVKKALLDGIAPDIVERALILTGEDGIPITETSLQYGTVKAKKEEELRSRSGAFSEQVGSQKGIASRLFAQDTTQGNAADYEGMF